MNNEESYTVYCTLVSRNNEASVFICSLSFSITVSILEAFKSSLYFSQTLLSSRLGCHIC